MSATTVTEPPRAGVPLTSDERRCLLAALRATREAEAVPVPAGAPEWERAESEDARAFGPRYSANCWWPDMPTPLRAKQLRCVYRLAERGLVSLHRAGYRLSRVGLTESGRRLAESIAE